MCYSSRSSGAWIALADSTVFIPENSPTFENEKEHFEEPRWNDGYYRGAKSIDGQQQCFEKLQERKPWSDSSCISTQTHMPILFRHPPIAAQGHGEKSLGESSQENKQFRCPSSVNVLVFGLWEETFTHTHTHTQKGGGGCPKQEVWSRTIFLWDDKTPSGTSNLKPPSTSNHYFNWNRLFISVEPIEKIKVILYFTCQKW